MPARYIPASIIAILSLVATIFFYLSESDFIRDMKITSGKVIKLGNKSTSTISINGKKTTTNTQAIVEIVVGNGTYVSEGRSFGVPKWEVGQDVEVYYSADDPKISRIKRWDELYFFTLISAFFLISCVVLGLVNYIVYRVRGRPLS